MMSKYGLQLQNIFAKVHTRQLTSQLIRSNGIHNGSTLFISSHLPLSTTHRIPSMKCITSDSSSTKQSYPASFEPLINRSLYDSNNVKKVILLLIENEVSCIYNNFSIYIFKTNSET